MELVRRDIIKSVIVYCFIAFCCKDVVAFSAYDDNVLIPFEIVKRNSSSQERDELPREDLCKCGIENDVPVGRIMGGSEVDPPHRYPWMAALIEEKFGRYFFFCGGALINRQYVLTASHCLDRRHGVPIHVALGIHDLHGVADEFIKVKGRKLHLYFTRATMHADIALLKLEDPVTYTKRIRPICLPEKIGMGLANDPVVVAGWGRLHPSGTVTRFLHHVALSVVDNTVCAAKFQPGDIVNSNICAGGQSGKDSCKGDSGGPLMYKKNNQWYEVGVVSWGESCGLPRYPGVYCRVSFYMDWVTSFSDDAPDCV